MAAVGGDGGGRSGNRSAGKEGPAPRRGGPEVRQRGAGGRTGGSLAARDGPRLLRRPRGGHEPQKGQETGRGPPESPVAKSHVRVRSQRPALRLRRPLRLSPGPGAERGEDGRCSGRWRAAHSPWGQLPTREPPEPSFPAAGKPRPGPPGLPEPEEAGCPGCGSQVSPSSLPARLLRRRPGRQPGGGGRVHWARLSLALSLLRVLAFPGLAASFHPGSHWGGQGAGSRRSQ